MSEFSPENKGDAEVLAQRYRGLPDEAIVAYIDESYRLAAQCREASEQPFYVLTAVLLRKSEHDGTRSHLVQIAGPGPWHTTKRQQRSGGRVAIEVMVDYLAGYRDACVLSVGVYPTATDTAISMRHACLAALLIELGKTEPAPGIVGPVPLIVFEKQREKADIDRDRHTIRLARQSGHLGRSVATLWVSPTVENLLWLPDLVSHCYYRYVTQGDDLVTRLDDQIITVKVPLNASDPLAAAAHVQGVSPLFP